MLYAVKIKCHFDLPNIKCKCTVLFWLLLAHLESAIPSILGVWILS